MKVFYDEDANLGVLKNKVLGIMGYGNQGRAQALNLRDSGLNVLVGTQADATAQEAREDGFQVVSVAELAPKADLLALLIPDEVQQRVYEESIRPHLCPGQTLLFSHGYAFHYRLIVPPPQVDVILVAPRMIGAMVRETYVAGSGAPAFVGVGQDASGHALETDLAYARGIGATRAGALETDFARETELDLFQEQALWPLLVRVMLTSYEFLVSKDFPPEMVALEMYGSGEAAEIFREMARIGFFKQMRLHSQTSQYGTLSRSQEISFVHEIHDFMQNALGEIRNRHFAEEWRREQAAGYPRFNELRALADEHPMNRAEELVRQMLRVKPG
ncbi:MAG: ketol-acid reductoisomerase [Terriglobia bacterium]